MKDIFRHYNRGGGVGYGDIQRRFIRGGIPRS